MTTVPSILKYLAMNNNNELNVMDQNTRAKKRRLDHLSWEEKIQRKKLKNRVAAQTSRDRKKQKMDEMQSALQELFEKNEIMAEECERLREANSRLTEENAELLSRVSAPCSCANANTPATRSRAGECEAQSGSAESLLRPKGTTTHSAAAPGPDSLRERRRARALLQTAVICLLCRICSTSSTSTNRSKSSRNLFSKISPETWRRLLTGKTKRNPSPINNVIIGKWWGRHQKNWNPVEVH